MAPTSAPIVMITGATSGIGWEVARRLAAAKADVIVHGPTNTEVEEAVVRLVHEGVSAYRLDYCAADFVRLADVRAMAKHIRAKYPRIDVLINNAATAAPSGRRETADGNELTFQVNYLAPYLLTRLLADRLKAADNPRMVAVSSSLHRTANINWSDPQRLKNYHPVAAYAQSKLALTMFARSLAAKEPRIATGSVHPGVVQGGLLSNYGRVGDPIAEGASAGPVPRGGHGPPGHR